MERRSSAPYEIFFLFGRVSMIFDPLVILDGMDATEKRYAPIEFAM